MSDNEKGRWQAFTSVSGTDKKEIRRVILNNEDCVTRRQKYKKGGG